MLITGLRTRLAAADAAYTTARARYEAWTVPPQGDAPPGDYQGYEADQAAESSAWLAREEAWFALHHPGGIGDGDD